MSFEPDSLVIWPLSQEDIYRVELLKSKPEEYKSRYNPIIPHHSDAVDLPFLSNSAIIQNVQAKLSAMKPKPDIARGFKFDGSKRINLTKNRQFNTQRSNSVFARVRGSFGS